MSAERWRGFGMGCIAGATLLAQLSLTRLLSVTLYHHVAFLVVSTAMFGLGLAGLVLTISPRISRLATTTLCVLGSVLFAVMTPLAFSVAQLVRLEPMALTQSPVELVRLAGTFILYAIPFFGSGLVISGLLTRHTADAPSLYACDLVGAGVGSFLGLLAIQYGRGPGALFVASGLALVAAAAFARPIARTALFAAAAIAVAGAPWLGTRLPLAISATKVSTEGEPYAEIFADPKRTKETGWSAFARVDRVEFAPGRERVVIDGGVAVVRVPPVGWKPRATDSTLPYELSAGSRALVIGSGAGWEVAEALAFGAEHVDAVEVSPLILRHVPPWLRTARVDHLVDEGRSFLERSRNLYGAIVMVHTISNAAVAGGALHLTEDYLLTAEAMDALLARLAPGGYLFVTRPESQWPRLIRTVAEAQARRGQDPADHIMAWVQPSPRGSSFYAAILTSRDPLPAEHQALVAQRIGALRGLRLALRPGHAPSDPLLLAALQPEAPAPRRGVHGVRIDPASDDRPFFHQRSRFSQLSFADLSRAIRVGTGARMALEDQPLAELSVLVLLIETTAIGALFLILPLALARRQRIEVRTKTAGACIVYFGALGIAFMLIEVALIQQLGLLLGRPALAFATVFAGILLGAGAGSRASPWLPHPRLAPLFAGIAAALLGLALVHVVRAALGGSTGLRVVIALLVVVPVGFVLGMAFPLGLLRTRLASPRLVPWAFALNSVASIFGTVLAIILATEIGFRGVLMVAAILYGLAALVFPALAGSGPSPSPADSHPLPPSDSDPDSPLGSGSGSEGGGGGGRGGATGSLLGPDQQ